MVDKENDKENEDKKKYYDNEKDKKYFDEFSNYLLAKNFDEDGDDYFKVKKETENLLDKSMRELDIVESKRRSLKTKISACKGILRFLNRVKRGKIRYRRKKNEDNNN